MISNNCNNFSVDGGIPRKQDGCMNHIMRLAPLPLFVFFFNCPYCPTDFDY